MLLFTAPIRGKPSAASLTHSLSNIHQSDIVKEIACNVEVLLTQFTPKCTPNTHFEKRGPHTLALKPKIAVLIYL